jgi:hypothetical protein
MAKSVLRRLAMAAAWISASVAAIAAAPNNSKPLFLFEKEEELRLVKQNNVRVQLQRTAGGRALRVEFHPAEWPNVAFSPQKPWDWSGFTGLAIKITNPGPEPVEFGVRVDDDPSANGIVHCRQGSGSIKPGKTSTFVLYLGPTPMSYGMRGLPVAPGFVQLNPVTQGDINLGNIVAFQVFLHAPKSPVPLILDDIRLVHYLMPLEGIVDEFGQYAKADWPGKLKSAAEFAVRRTQEEAELKAKPELPGRDRFGGWKRGPRLEATGFFRTEKVNGKWWLVDPDGYLFFSIGMDCVNYQADTIITGREYMFLWVPPKTDPLAKYFGHVSNVLMGPVKQGETFNFFAANLERKYGPNFAQTWFDVTLRRLKAWGFNTIANWSDWVLHRNGRVPYVATAHISGEHARISSGSDYWGRMHDPFDPKFAQSVSQSLAPLIARVKDDPWCIGYFVDNELSWGGWGDDGGRYGLAYGALAESAQSPAKQAFLAQLKAKYGDIAKLNAAWGTDFPSWDALEAPFKPQQPLRASAHPDLGAFVKSLAARYFRTIRDELKKHDPNHLYLGCRFAWRTPEAVEASAEYCDVVSFNIYAPRVDPAAWSFLEKLGKPCIIGEFHFGALDRGMFHTGLVATESQKARAAMYKDYLRSVIDNPALVGCHWFQYVDQPLTGRPLDGENYNIGFITVTDTPYPEMVAAAKAVHREAYPRRYRTKAPSAQGG